MLKFNLEQEISQRNIQWSPGFDTQKVPHGNGYNKKTNTTSKFGIRTTTCDKYFYSWATYETWSLNQKMCKFNMFIYLFIYFTSFITAFCFLSCLITHLISSLSLLVTTSIVLNQKFPFCLLKKIHSGLLTCKMEAVTQGRCGTFPRVLGIIWVRILESYELKGRPNQLTDYQKTFCMVHNSSITFISFGSTCKRSTQTTLNKKDRRS